MLYLRYLGIFSLIMAILSLIPFDRLRGGYIRLPGSYFSPLKRINNLSRSVYLQKIFPKKKKSYGRIEVLINNSGFNLTPYEVYVLKLFFPVATITAYSIDKVLQVYGMPGFMTGFMFVSGTVCFYLPEALLSAAGWYRTVKIRSELPFFIETIENLSNVSNDMSEIIALAANQTKTLKKPFMKAVDNWADGPEKALRRAGEEINYSEVDFLITLLIEAVGHSGSQKEFLQQHRAKLEEFRNADREVWESIKPALLMAAVSVPAILTVIIWFLPTLFNMIESLPYQDFQYIR